jgi:hypothetical protein
VEEVAHLALSAAHRRAASSAADKRRRNFDRMTGSCRRIAHDPTPFGHGQKIAHLRIV